METMVAGGVVVVPVLIRTAVAIRLAIVIVKNTQYSYLQTHVTATSFNKANAFN